MTKKIFFMLTVVAIAIGSCSKEENDPKKNTTPTNTYVLGVNANCGSTFTFQGKSIDIRDACGGYGYSGYPDSISIDYLGTLLDQQGNSFNEITLRYGTWRSDSMPTEAQFRAFVTKGAKPFTQELGNGVQIEIEIDGVPYNAGFGTNNQSGGSFVINDVIFYEEFNELYAKLDAQFNCVVYDANGNSVPITNGRFVGTLANTITF